MDYRVLRVAVVGALAVSCGGNGGTEPRAQGATKLVLVTEPLGAQTTIPLTTQPVVQATDASGTAMAAAATITAEVVSGNGTVTAGGTAPTNASGLATFSALTLGAVLGRVGPVTVRFSAPGLDPVTAVIDLRCALLPVQVGQTINRALSAGDCTFNDGSFLNEFELTTTQAVTAVQLTLDGTFRPYLVFRGANEPVFYWGDGAAAASTRVGFKLLMPAGRNRVIANSFNPGVTGNYTLSVASTPEDVGCEPVYVASPVTTAQRLATGDCAGTGFLADFFFIGLQRGATITASMASDAFAPAIALEEDATGAAVAQGTGAGSAGFVFTNNSGADRLYYIRASSGAAGGAGAYTLNVSVAYPATATAAPLAALAPPPRGVRPSQRVMPPGRAGAPARGSRVR